MQETNQESRRQWLGMALAGGVVASAGFARSRIRPQPAPPPASPQEALERLYAGNRRFVAGAGESAHQDHRRLMDLTARQTPFAAFLGCADSRVPIEIVFDQGFGDLFVTRIAGNVAATENVASLEFGTEVLGAQVLYVLGHTSCGAVAAAARREAVPGQISALFQHIHPAVRRSGGDIGAAIRENVRVQAQVVREASPVIASLVDAGKLIVAGGIFDLRTGRVEPVDMG